MNEETACQKFQRLVPLPVRDGEAAPDQLQSHDAPAALVINVLSEIIVRLERLERP